MFSDIARLRKPRCILLYSLAPEGVTAAEANHAFNEFVADDSLPLVLWHDHFIGEPGGVAIIYTEKSEEREALVHQEHLDGWRTELRPLIFSFGPAAFDEQIRFTLQAYRGMQWDKLRTEERPSYGEPRREAETAREDLG